MSARLTVGADAASYVLVGTQIVSGAAASSFSFTGLNLEGVVGYRLLALIKNAVAGASDVAITYNNDTTATNYERQELDIGGAGVGASRNNSNNIGTILAGAGTMAMFDITFKKISGSIPVGHSQEDYGAFATIAKRDNSFTWNNTDNVTRIDLIPSTASAIAIGSTCSLYKFV